MTTFTDGPAAGVRLMLRRAPYFLRVTDNGKEWDALNNLDDVAEPQERLYLYTWTNKLPGGMHLLIRGKNRNAGGFYAIADYAFRPEQPPDEIMRDNEKWVEWCNQHIAEYDAFKQKHQLREDKAP